MYKRSIKRSTTAIIGLIVSLLAIVSYIVKVSMDYQKLKSKLDQNEENDKRERERIFNTLKENDIRYGKKFDELYDSRNKTNEALIELTTTIKMMTQNMNQQFSNLEKKIDDIKGKE